MKKSPSYQALLITAAVCLGLNILVSLGVIGLVLKIIGLVALVWGVIEFFKNSEEFKGKIKK